MTKQIGRFTTDRILGTGAFATVWLPRDDQLDDWVAIKVLAENWAFDEEVRARFIEEAQILRKLSSQHVVPIHDVGELDDGRPYLVMPFADGGTLGERTSGTPVDVATAVDWSMQIARALSDAHHAGIANRDLKPANIMFRTLDRPDDQGRTEHVWVGDFGIAKNLARSRGTTISTGTPHYMAPEQVDGKADERSDIYSAAVVLYELLSGRVPYPFDSLMNLMRAHQSEAPPQLEPNDRGLTPQLAAAVHAGLSIDPAGRPQTADAWAESLRLGLSGAGAAATGPSAAGAQTPPHSAPDPDATMAPPRYRNAGTDAAAGAAGGGMAGPPPGPQPTPDASPPPGPKSSRPWWKVALPVAAVMALLAGGLLVLANGGSDDGDGVAVSELVLEPISSVGADPFSAPIVPGSEGGPPAPDPLPTGTAGSDPDELATLLGQLNTPIGELAGFDFGDLELPSGGDRGVNVGGSAPGLYGGTNVINVCDIGALKGFLTENFDKARAWAETHGIDVPEIPDYLDSLTDVILQTDTRVTNHGFKAGAANAIDSVLQAGTAVLVDKFGVPRVRCYCGNPLKPARPIVVADPPEVSGAQWAGFDLADTIEINPLEELSTFQLDDVLSTNVFLRDTAASPAAAVVLDATGTELAQGTATTAVPATTAAPTTAAPTTAAPTTAAPTTAPPTTAAPTTAAPTLSNIASQGTISASSVYSNDFVPSLAVDGDESTSWFSAGGGSATFTWDPGGKRTIDTITVVGNGGHANPGFRTGFGFGSVRISVEVDGELISVDQDLSGTPDPTVMGVYPGEVDRVILEFTGGEDPTCGGFSELIITGV